jgi:hypothetical protein
MQERGLTDEADEGLDDGLMANKDEPVID